MKKTTLCIFALLMASTMFGQTFSTGTVTLFPDYTGQIDVSATTVTLTLVGPSDSWMGMGFNSSSMDDVGNDVVIFDGTNMTDRTYAGVGVEPIPDASQDWTVTSNVVNANVRTVVATRAANTGDSNDFVFTPAAQPLSLAFARSVGSLDIVYHGHGNCGATVANFALGNASFATESFTMFPNPAKEYTTIGLPTSVETGEAKVYDNLGRVVKVQTITRTENKIQTSDLPQGTYLVVIRTDYGNATKSLLVE